MTTPPTEPPPPPAPNPPMVNLPPHAAGDPESRRCIMCGYSLAGAPERGICPECGHTHGPTTDHWLKPWPNGGKIFIGIAWPLVLLVILSFVTYLYLRDFNNDLVMFAIAGLIWLFALIAPLNGYLYVRALLKRHLPENVRTRGTVAWLRGLGTVVCGLVFAGAVFVFLAPLILLGACLILGPPKFH